MSYIPSLPSTPSQSPSPPSSSSRSPSPSRSLSLPPMSEPPLPLRHCISTGNIRPRPVAVTLELLQIQQLQLYFENLRQSDLPLHQYAHRVLGISSRLGWIGYPIESHEKIRVLLRGLNPNHEDMRQLLLTKARRWKITGEIEDEEEIFLKLVALVRFYAFEREGERDSDTTPIPTIATSSRLGSPPPSSISYCSTSSSSSSSGSSTERPSLDSNTTTSHSLRKSFVIAYRNQRTQQIAAIKKSCSMTGLSIRRKFGL